jgi:tRNA U34 5-methylaminomethyl-2-thiouridine-forming methyltransferase MnmC
MMRILTKDNSVTFFNEEYQEHYHSVSGALEESFKKYVEPCRVKELAEKGKIEILDICFGLGYNSIAAISVALQANKGCEIEITALEKDEKILAELQNITLTPSLEAYYTKLKEQLRTQRNPIVIGEAKINLLLGDARQTIIKIQRTFDAVFLDPFSPKKNPELWALEFFKDIKRLMKKHAVLATYSCARIVRENLRTAGFIVKDGPIVGRKAPATIALVE